MIVSSIREMREDTLEGMIEDSINEMIENTIEEMKGNSISDREDPEILGLEPSSVVNVEPVNSGSSHELEDTAVTTRTCPLKLWKSDVTNLQILSSKLCLISWFRTELRYIPKRSSHLSFIGSGK